MYKVKDIAAGNHLYDHHFGSPEILPRGLARPYRDNLIISRDGEHPGRGYLSKGKPFPGVRLLVLAYIAQKLLPFFRQHSVGKIIADSEIGKERVAMDYGNLFITILYVYLYQMIWREQTIATRICREQCFRLLRHSTQCLNKLTYCHRKPPHILGKDEPCRSRPFVRRNYISGWQGGSPRKSANLLLTEPAIFPPCYAARGRDFRKSLNLYYINY